MRKYNLKAYNIYKEDLGNKINLVDFEKPYDELTKDELIVRFLPLVENIARKFSTASQASGVMDILDLIQEGSIGLMKAIDRIDWNVFNQSKYKENTMKAFLSKRIKGAIRRAILIRTTADIAEIKTMVAREGLLIIVAQIV